MCANCLYIHYKTIRISKNNLNFTIYLLQGLYQRAYSKLIGNS